MTGMLHRQTVDKPHVGLLSSSGSTVDDSERRRSEETPRLFGCSQEVRAGFTKFWTNRFRKVEVAVQYYDGGSL